jgi:hypothetical protein
MPSDLEGNLVEGGLSPAAAKLIANAIDNAATGRLSTGRQLEDSTPVDRMRLITPDTRRYVLTNLDYPSTASPRPYQPHGRPHPYQDSQPATANPTISTPGVTAGQFVSVSTGTANEVSQAEVSLNIQQMGGQHARLNPGSGAVEAVPISVQFEPEGLLEGEVIEEAGKTVIKIRIVNTALRQMLRKRLGASTAITTPSGGGTLFVDGVAVVSGGAFVLMPE